MVERLRGIRDALGAELIERDVPVRLALLAALAGEHLLLLGPPGTAKSELARRLRHALRGATYFERLLTRFSVPEELFGPLSIKALEEDRYERQTGRYLPTATIAFLDEIFKANSAILNSLLTLLNERQFDNGVERVTTPLVSVIGASNELPEGEELHALFDRFLLRYPVASVSDAGFDQLLQLRGTVQPRVDDPVRLDAEELRRIRDEAVQVEVPGDVYELLRAFRKFLVDTKIFVSDRRWRKIVALLQVAAWTNGRRSVSIWDAWLLEHCAWEKPEQREGIAAWYNARMGTAAPEEPDRYVKLISAFEQLLERESTSTSQARDAEGRLLYRGANGKPTTDEDEALPRRNAAGEPLYLAPAGREERRQRKAYTAEQLLAAFRYSGYGGEYILSNNDAKRLSEYIGEKRNWLTEKGVALNETTRYSEAHVRGRLSQVGDLQREVAAYQDLLARQIASIDSTIRGDLWIPPGFEEIARRHLDDLRTQTEKLAARMAVVATGFDALPRSAE